MPNALILGANSFIGAELINWIGNNTTVGIEGTVRFKSNIFWECDVTNITSIEQVIRKIKPDYIFNCTGISDHNSCEVNPCQALETNVNAVGNILYWIKEYGLKTKFVNLGSIKEITDNSFYSVTKRMSREIVEFYRSKNVWAAQLYISNTSGRRQDPDRFLVPKIIRAAKLIKEGEFLELGNLDSEIKLLDVQSACSLIWKAAQNESPVDYAIDGLKIKVSDLAQIIFEKFGIEDFYQYIRINPELYRPTVKMDLNISPSLTVDKSLDQIIEKLI